MNSKKSNKADLEKKRPLFFEIGLTIALALALLAFELSPKETTTDRYLSCKGNDYLEPIDAIITRIEKEKKMEKPKVIKIEIVDNKIEIPEPDFNFNSEIDPNEGIDFVPWEPKEETEEKDDTFILVEKMPEYRNGGLDNFHKHIQQIVHYPEKAMDLGLEGTVILYFVVNKSGDVTDIKVLKSIDPMLDNAAIAAIRQSEKWKPGKQTGRPVNVAMTMPVSFQLQ